MENRLSSKLLNVVSKAGLGYIGRLHAIDTKHYTVTLSNVRVVNSANGDQMCPKVYEFVIFRGSDIQEVSVRKSTPQDNLMENDAAVSVKDVPNQCRQEVHNNLDDACVCVKPQISSNQSNGYSKNFTGYQYQGRKPEPDARVYSNNKPRVPFRPTYSRGYYANRSRR